MMLLGQSRIRTGTTYMYCASANAFAVGSRLLFAVGWNGSGTHLRRGKHSGQVLSLNDHGFVELVQVVWRVG